jgi:hypothetical protein
MQQKTSPSRQGRCLLRSSRSGNAGFLLLCAQSKLAYSLHAPTTPNHTHRFIHGRTPRSASSPTSCAQCHLPGTGLVPAYRSA